jgi:GNAT superfamily N-acetyltransferase
MSIVGLIEEAGVERIIAEGRYVCLDNNSFADTAFVVDEELRGKGIASFLLQLLIQTAHKRGIRGFKADVLTANKAMMKVFEKTQFPVKAVFSSGLYELSIPFYPETAELSENE